MAVKKGLKSLIESEPNFSNQGLENAINDIKTKVDRDWVTRTFDLDQAIEDNNVLSLTQKNDLKETLNLQPYLNIGRYLNDVIRHTNTILDGTIVNRANPDTEDTASFLEILQTVQSLQTSIPSLHGVPASEKSRGVNDHLGTLNNMFLETEDSSKPVFESLIEQLQTLNRFNLNAVKDNGDLETTLDNLIAFINSVVADSTDFQQTLDNYANLVKLQFQGLNISLTTTGFSADERFQQCAAQLLADYNTVEDQRLLEISNLSGIRTYSESLTNNMGYTSLAEDPDLRKFMSRVSGNTNWQTYFNDYEANLASLDPIYETNADSDKETVINQILVSKGLPDVLDYVDILGVANKAKKDDRIDTKAFESYTDEQIITKCCEQLGLNTANNSIYNQSQSLLTNLNDRDRQVIADALDANQASNTLS
jgi:hypothetical protein